jgi:hypothetical protein
MDEQIASEIAAMQLLDRLIPLDYNTQLDSALESLSPHDKKLLLEFDIDQPQFCRVTPARGA